MANDQCFRAPVYLPMGSDWHIRLAHDRRFYRYCASYKYKSVLGRWRYAPGVYLNVSYLPWSDHDWSSVIDLRCSYDSTIGPLTCERRKGVTCIWQMQLTFCLLIDVIVPEIPSSRLRHKTTVIARNMYNVTCVWTGVLTPSVLSISSGHASANCSLSQLYVEL